ncbi:MAG: carbohydrate kinase [Nocardioidaceae bacterium]|nr:carbohydrate kinase [Nocardioidaceae bacterium]NUS50052.1 carbohydrate kinase [Nocardioidaceae bacterium]
MSGRFLVVGESLVDIVLPVDGPREDAVGGSPLNVAVGLARLDVPTTLVTLLGDDDLGRAVADHAHASDVLLSEGSVVVGRTTSTATAHLDEQHAATYDFDLVWDLPRQELPDEVRGVHVGSLGASLHPGRASVVDLVTRAAADDVFVSYDPNIRPFFLEDAEAAWRDVVEVGAAARLVKLSDEDLHVLRPDEDAEKVCRELLASEQTELVVLTRGPEGATAYALDAVVDVPAPPTDVVDTVGAGDSFMAAMLALLCDWGVVDGGAGKLSALDDDRLRMLVGGAVTAAAVTCSRRGANPPTRRELPTAWPAS